MAILYPLTGRTPHFSSQFIYQRKVDGNSLKVFDLVDGDIVDIEPASAWPERGLVLIENQAGDEDAGFVMPRPSDQVILFYGGKWASPERHQVRLKGWIVGHYRSHQVILRSTALRLVKAEGSKKVVCGTKLAGGGQAGKP